MNASNWKGAGFRVNPRRLARAAGWGVSLLCLWFVGRTLQREWIEVAPRLSAVDSWFMVVAVGLGALAMASMALAWRSILRARGQVVSSTGSLSWYFLGELAKYIPGGIWAVVGRSELAVRGGIARRVAYESTFLSLALVYLAPAVVALGFVLKHTAIPPGDLPAEFAVIGAVFVAGMGCVALLFLVRIAREHAGTALGVLLTSWRGQQAALIQAGGFSLLAWIWIVAATAVVAGASGAEIPLAELAPATLAAWAVGFMVIPAPGGLGVREGAFVLALAHHGEGTVALIALLARSVFISADVAGAAFAFALGRIWGVTARVPPEESSA